MNNNDLQFKQFLLKLKKWLENEITLGKDYEIQKGQVASYGKGYDNALENVLKQIKQFEKGRLKRDETENDYEPTLQECAEEGESRETFLEKGS